MRKVATSSIVEFKSDKIQSSSLTTLETVGTDNDHSYEKDRYVGSSYNGSLPAFSGIGIMNNFGTTVMLARNGKLVNLPLSDETKRLIKIANQQQSTFIVGDMPGVDSQFIDYLQEIGAKFTVYHTGSTPRIEVKQPTTQPAEAATNFKIGQYVSYNKNGDVYIVTKALEGNKYQIYNPNKEGAAAKLQVSADNILPYKALFAKIVEYNPGENYIVTSAGTIISLTSNKKMNFLPNDGRRVKILALASGATSTSAMSYETMTPEDQWLQYGNKLIEKYGPGIKDVWTEKDQDFRNHKIKCL